MSGSPTGRESIEESRQQNGTCSIDAFHVRQIELNGPTVIELSLGVRNFQGRDRCVREIEWTGGYQTYAVARPILPNDLCVA
jgi:hypothetical protein